MRPNPPTSPPQPQTYPPAQSFQPAQLPTAPAPRAAPTAPAQPLQRDVPLVARPLETPLKQQPPMQPQPQKQQPPMQQQQPPQPPPPVVQAVIVPTQQPTVAYIVPTRIFFQRQGQIDCFRIMCTFALAAAVFVAIIGGALLVTGSQQKNGVGGLDPSRDFEFLGEACRVVSVQECFRTELTDSKRVRGCERQWLPTIEVRGEVMSAEREERFRNNEDCGRGCRNATAAATESDFRAGQTVPCWRSTATTGRSGTDGVYECENQQCVKVYDPREDIESAALTSEWSLWVGGALFGAAFLSLFILAFVWYCCYTTLPGGRRKAAA